MEKEKNMCANYKGLHILLSLAILLSLVAISMHITETIITSESIVLFFIGVLATFIVVGNYIQIYQMEQKIKEMDAQTKEMIMRQETAHKLLLSSAKNIILSLVHLQMKASTPNYDKAFLYALDLLPIIPELYGNDTFEVDAYGERVEACIAVFITIMDDNAKAPKFNISEATMQRALEDIKKYLPDSYKKRVEVVELKRRIEKEISIK